MNKHQTTLSVLLWICGTSVTGAAEPSRPSITFLDEPAARTSILDDSLAPYFDQLQPMEMLAKTGSAVPGNDLQQQRAECRKRYQAGVRTFTPEEKEALSWHVNQLHPFLIKDYPLLAQMPWSFLKLSDTIEGGLPHTRGNHIVLSDTACRSIVSTWQQQSSPMSVVGTMDMLSHEQMHVFQRLHPGHLDPLYINLWGFIKTKTIIDCPWLIKHHLANPDGVDCSWVLPVQNGQTVNYLWPLVVFSEGDHLKHMPMDFRMIAISLNKTDDVFRVETDKDKKPVFSNLMEVPQFRALFPMSTDIYHPDEASADVFAKVVVFDHFFPKASLPPSQSDQIEKYLLPLRTWFKSNLSARPSAPATSK